MSVVQQSSINNTQPIDYSRPMNMKENLYKPFSEHSVRIYHEVLTAVSTSGIIFKDVFAEFYTDATTATLGQKFKNLSYVYGNLKIKVVVQGQPFAAGQVLYTFTPRTFAPLAATGTRIFQSVNIVNSKIVPHIIIDPSKTATYELSLPPVTTTGYYDLSGSTVHGSYQMERIVFNPLFSGTATAPSCAICMYASLENPEFGAITFLADFSAEKEDSPKLSVVAKSASTIANNIGKMFPTISPFTTLFSNVSNTVGNVLYSIGYSKPLALNNHHLITNRHVDNFTQMDGHSTSYHLSGTQSNSIAISSSMVGGTDSEVELEYLCSIPALIRQFSVSTATAAGILIGSIAVSPTRCYSPAALNIAPTPLAGVAECFEYWCGDLTYRVEVVASVFHRFTLLVAYEPTSSSVPTFDVAVALLKNTTINVSGNTAVDIMIPWSTVRPYKEVALMTVSTVTETVNNTNGWLHFFVVNPITSNGSTDPLPINVYAYSKNITFQVPHAHPLNNNIIKTELLGYFSEPVTLSPTSMVTFGEPTSLEKLHLLNFGEQYSSIKHLTNKLNVQFYGEAFNPGGSTNVFISLIYPNVPVTVTDVSSFSGGTTYFNFFAWFSAAFVGYRGSIRYGARINENTQNSTLLSEVLSSHTIGNVIGFGSPFGTTNTFNNLVDEYNSYAYTMHLLNLTPMIDFVSNMLNPYRFLPTRLSYTSNNDKIEVYWASDQNALPTTYCCTLVSATADDGTFCHFVGFPILAVTA